MNTRALDTILLIITVALWLLALIFPQVLNYSFEFFLLIIFSVGIPHGALDHIIHGETGTPKKKNMKMFYLVYIGLIGLVGFFWFLFPTFSFILFLILSAYHFGQSQLYYITARSPLNHLIYFCWGAFVLSTMIAMNYEQCLDIFASLEWLNVKSWMSIHYPRMVSVATGLLLGIAFFLLRSYKHISTGKIVWETALLLVLVLLSFHTEVVYTFTIYFGLWHSLRSLIMEYKSLKQVISNYTVQRFFHQILPYSLVAIFFLILIYSLGEIFTFGISPYMLFIILISTLTVPHLIVMYNLYKVYETNIRSL